jgi:hypothetical protein
LTLLINFAVSGEVFRELQVVIFKSELPSYEEPLLIAGIQDFLLMRDGPVRQKRDEKPVGLETI